MKTPFFALIALLFLLTLTFADGQSLIGSRAPEFILYDQHDKPYTIMQNRGKIIILLASDRKGSEQNKAWVESIEKKYKDRVPIIGIADLRRVPRVFEAVVKREFRNKPASILLDWNGDIFKSYGLAQKVANIVLVDKNGFLQYLYSGEATTDACEKLFWEIDKQDPE
jgi:hypothetical protein